MILASVKYIRKMRMKHAREGKKIPSNDFESWTKLLNGYSLWCRKSAFIAGFDRKYAPVYDIIFEVAERERKRRERLGLIQEDEVGERMLRYAARSSC